MTNMSWKEEPQRHSKAAKKGHHGRVRGRLKHSLDKLRGLFGGGS